MSEPSLIHLLHSRWQEIVRCFWPETPRQGLEAELARLDAELEQRQFRLLVLRKKIEKMSKSLHDRDRFLGMLAEGIRKGVVEADPMIERWMRDADHLRERLHKREYSYALLLARLRRRKQERDELRARLLSGSLPKPVDEESDPDYPF